MPEYGILYFRIILYLFLTPGLRQMRGNLDCFGDIHKMKNSLRMEFCIFSCSITYIKHFDTQCIFTTALK